MIALMSNTKSQLDHCADEVISAGMAVLQIVGDDQVTPEELRALRTIGRGLLASGRRLERVSVGMRMIEQIWRIGVDRAPNERLLRRIREVQRLPEDDR
jgi:hypothetical protein